MPTQSDICYARLMAESVPEDEAERIASELHAYGARQTSAKYRNVAWLPPGETGLQALERVDPRAAEDIRRRIEDQCADTYLRVYAERDGNQRSLDLRTFQAFKRIERERRGW